ncbi:MAG: flagellin FliC [Burkholderiales bacterium]|nr:flagellin FliC [Burkholderiales bacterium]
MTLSINTNLISMGAQFNLNKSQNSLATSMQRLSSGLRINSAADDAAGLAIASRMQTQVNGMNVATQNANNAISLAQTAEGALGSVTDSLQRMRQLAVQARDGTNTSTDRASLDNEYQALAAEIQRVLGGTTFNGQAILGSGATTVNFQIGANTTSNDSISISMTNMTVDSTITAVTGSTASLATTSDSAIASVINNIDSALATINTQRSDMGAYENRFNAVISNLNTSVQNQSAAQSRIMDANFAAETANLSRAQVLQQAGNAMVAQANQLPQMVLKLLQ